MFIKNADFSYPMSRLEESSNSGLRLLEEERFKILEPFPRKQTPIWTMKYLCEALDELPSRISNLINHDPNNNYPHGTSKGQGKQREFSIDDVYAWMKKLKPSVSRPDGKRGRICAVSNLKGGSGKSSTVVPLAQALALSHGRTCCIIDLDPQGTATQLMGWASDIEIGIDDTVAPFLYEDTNSLMPVVRQTYWKNVACVPACTSLFDVEFHVSKTVGSKKSVNHNWQGLKKGLHELAEHFDLVILDCPPSVSHITMSAIMASDSLIVPMQPSPLDFAATTKYFSLMDDIFSHVPDIYNEKVFDFVNILISRDKNTPITAYVADWIKRAYGPMVLPMTIPDSRAVETAYAAFGTIYDHPKPTGTADAHYRYKRPFDDFVSFINQQLEIAWSK